MSDRLLLDTFSDATRRVAWIVFLTAASVAFSLIFACATPFAALAAFAALSVRRRDAYALTGAVWLANQAVGYGILHYPRTPDSFAWGLAIGASALLATHAVIWINEQRPTPGPVLATARAFLAAFVAYEGLLYAVSFGLGGTETGFTLHVVAYVLQVNVLALAGLIVLSLGAGAIGLAQSVPAAASRH